MALMAFEVVPPVAPRNFEEIIFTFQFTPTTPTLLAFAPIVPET
jgi:hypothetical protein